MSQILDRADLFYREGSSDKVYHLQLVKQTDGSEPGEHRVDFQYGRRGSTLNFGTKIEGVSLNDARKVYDKLFGEKTGKGYQIIPEGQEDEYISPDVPKATTKHTKASAAKSSAKASIKPIEPLKRRILWQGNNGEESAKATTELILPQLLTRIEETELERYLRDDNFAGQEKKDGRHQIVIKTADKTRVTNKKGKDIGFPSAFGKIAVTAVLDGEAIGEIFHAFDLLELEGEDLRGLGYGERFNRLNNLTGKLGTAVKVVPLAIGYAQKKALYERLRKENKEGIVFKKLDAPHRAGKGSDMLKYKFLADASCRVREGRKGKRSVGIELLDENGIWVAVGNVTIGSPKIPLPPIKSIIDVSYLYFFRGGSLFQPVYKGQRDDVDESECTLKQLKYKADEEDIDE